MKERKNITYRQALLLNVLSVIIVISAILAYQVIAAPNNDVASSTLSLESLSYQGTLIDNAGNPVSGNQGMTFRMYDSVTGGTLLWEEGHSGSNAVPIIDGLFNVLLGSLKPIPDSVWQESDLYLGIQIDGENEMIPRELVNLLPPQIATGSLDSNVLKSNTMSSGPFPSYYFGMNTEYTLFVNNHVTGEHTEINASSCPVNNTWCCNAEDTICINRSSSGVDRLAVRMQESHSVACWLVHQEDDNPSRSEGISYATDWGNDSSPFVSGSVFYFSREGDGNYPIATNSGYLIVCFN